MMDPTLTQFCRQYLQQVNAPCFPSAKTLLNSYVQDQIYRYMFDPSILHLPPVRYRKRILKIILERIESAIEDPDEDEISDALMNNMASLCLSDGLSATDVARQKSVLSYFPPLEETFPILISESPQLLAAGGVVGLRTWDACLRLASFLSTEGKCLVKDKTIIELGAGTGMLSILCKSHLDSTSVLATDGIPEIVSSMKTNIALNLTNFPEVQSIRALHYDWSDNDTLTQSLGLTQTSEWPHFDLILGADITYNPDYFKPLVQSLTTLLALNETATILIAGAIRNGQTHEQFVDTCSENHLEIFEVEYECPPLHQQKGFFHAIALPIKIMQIRRGITPRDGSRKVMIDPKLSRFVLKPN